MCETTVLPFEETYRDACLLLGAPLARGHLVAGRATHAIGSLYGGGGKAVTPIVEGDLSFAFPDG
jgi:hypothetical protein